MKEDLPRIAYCNPTLGISVNKIPKKPEDVLVPEMQVVFRTFLIPDCLFLRKFLTN